MALPAVKKKAFSGSSNLFNGYLEQKLNETRAGASSSTQQSAIAALTVIATADATDLPSAIALTNANKAKINAIIAALKTA
jgi:hypothetical protein